MKLILASNSRTRKEVLDKVGVTYSVIPSNIEEHSDKTDPKEYAMDLSRQKAEAIAKNIKDGVILSADSIIYIDDRKLEKPKTKEQAKEMLKSLSGRVNYAVTDSKLKVDEKKSEIALNLQIDEKICSMYDYFEIFLGRMMLCRKSAEILGTTFKLTVNGRKVL